MIGIQSSSNAGQSQRPSLSIGLIEFGSRARLIRVRVGCPVSYRNSFLPVARFGSCYVRITVGYGDPARGQVRKLLRLLTFGSESVAQSIQIICRNPVDIEFGPESAAQSIVR